jgi:hypothetical protein
MATGNPNVRRDPDSSLAWGCAWWWFLWLILLIIFFGGGWWWGGWYGPTPWQGQRTAQAPLGPTAVQAPAGQQQATPPAEFLGRGVTVSGKVDAVLGAQAFTLASPAAGGRSLLVVTSTSATSHPTVTAGETVQVKGTVHPFDRAEFDKDAKANLPQSATEPYMGRPAILATAVSEVSPK